MADQKNPKARLKNLEVQELSDETLLYDLERHKAHCLNRSVALVWKASDGTRDVSQIAAALQEELKTPVQEEVVWVALEQLQKAHLLEIMATRPESAKLSRREMARTLGKAALIPAIASLLAPTAAKAATCKQSKDRATGCPCAPPNKATTQCENGFCLATGKCN